MDELECLHTSLGRRFYRMRRKEMAGENGRNKNGARKVAGKRAGGRKKVREQRWREKKGGTMAGKNCGTNGGGKLFESNVGGEKIRVKRFSGSPAGCA